MPFEQPQRPPTNPQKARFLLLGAGQQSGVYRSREDLPIIPRGPDCPFVPLFIACTSPELAQELEKLVPYFECFVGKRRDQLVSIFDLMEERSDYFKFVMNAKRTVYSLLLGIDDHQAYYLYWPDIWPWTAHEKYQKSICKREESFRQIMEWTIETGSKRMPYGIPRNKRSGVRRRAWRRNAKTIWTRLNRR
ncbi:hypothetical protein NM688_g8621 [Phlebia brevispora]|uniref:Uncharacterized protein n=1 Tax=Phlebia brevispora TaxID=194682 RepID=A0ACC1RS89_9APHY|nr:hypothetical protein NM688_g8621 [Phlebia brevispora]